MNKKALMLSLIILMIPVLYTISTVTATFNRSVSYSSVKGGECGSNLEWVSYESQIRDLDLGWARIPLKWKKAIYGYPSYSLKLDSDEYRNFKSAMTKANSMGLKIIVTIKDVPDDFLDPGLAGFTTTPMLWPTDCGRIAVTRIVSSTPEKGIDRLKIFVVAVLNNLALEGLPVQYIELWNEPDVEAYRSELPALYGCWARFPYTPTIVSTASALTATALFNAVAVDAGNYYAKVLSTVVAYKNAQLPASTVEFAGPAAAESRSAFLDVVIATSVSNNNIDLLTYHQYVPSYNKKCYASEGLAIQEASFAHVRSDLDLNGGAGKPILISEGAMTFPISTTTATPAPLFFDCQGSYARSLLTWLSSKESTGNLKGSIWYTIGYNGWQYSDLLYPTRTITPKPVYFAWRDPGPPAVAPMIVKNYQFSTPQSRGMGDSGQSEQVGAYPPPLDDSAPGIDQPPDQSGQVPYPAPDLGEDAVPGAEPSLDQNDQAAYPAPDLGESAVPGIEPSPDQNIPLPSPTPSPVETPTPGLDPTLEQATPTPSLTPTP